MLVVVLQPSNVKTLLDIWYEVGHYRDYSCEIGKSFSMISSTTPHFTPTHKSFTHNEERKMSVGVTNIEQNGYTRYMHVEQSDTQMIDGTSNIILISRIKTNKKKKTTEKQCSYKQNKKSTRVPIIQIAHSTHMSVRWRILSTSVICDICIYYCSAFPFNHSDYVEVWPQGTVHFKYWLGY